MKICRKILVVAVLLVLIVIVTVHYVRRFERRSSRFTPEIAEFSNVHLALTQLAFDVKWVADRTNVGSLDELCLKIRDEFPETDANSSFANPFPGLLPERKFGKYGRMRRRLAQPNDDSPLIWATVLGGETVEYITWRGQFVSENAEVFARRLSQLTNAGAVISVD